MSDDDADAPRGVSGRWVVVLGALSGAVVLALTIGAAVLAPAVLEARREANRVACGNTLRTLALAALEYRDGVGGGSFPWAWQGEGIGGGPETAYTPRSLTLLSRSGLLDPAGFLCPAAPAPRRGRARSGAAWIAAGADPAEAPALLACDAIRYGWTRRRLGRDAAASAPLAADRAVVALVPSVPPSPLSGNHSDGWSVATADGAVRWRGVADEPFPGATLAKTSDPERDGFLCIADQDDPSSLR